MSSGPMLMSDPTWTSNPDKSSFQGMCSGEDEAQEGP
jgi:hypothetical protein